MRTPPKPRTNEYELPLTRPRPIRDATNTRPASMYAGTGILDGPVQSAIERTVAPKSSTGQLRAAENPTDHSPKVRSKWSQYFTSTASPQVSLAASNVRARSGSMQHSPKHTELVQSAAAARDAVVHKRGGEGEERQAYNSGYTYDAHTRLGLGPAANATKAKAAAQQPKPPSSIQTVAARNVTSAFDTRQRGTAHGAGSPLSPATDILRSRSATLPDMHAGGERACSTCGTQLRACEQRQFASQPGVVYCTQCYHSSYSRGHCAGCSKIVLTHGRPWVQCGESVWHKLCIKCRSCNRMLLTPLVDLEGLPTCEPCFMKVNPGGSSPRPMPTDSASSAKPRAMTHTQQPRDMSHTQQPRAMSHTQQPRAMSHTQQPQYQPKSQPQYQPKSQPQSQPKSQPQPYPRTKDDCAADEVAASIPTPALTDYDRAPSSDLCVSPGQFGYIDSDPARIMSPVEVAAKEGLPLPRHIVDPDIGAISLSESQPRSVPGPSTPSPHPPPIGPRRALPQPRSVSGSSKLNPLVTPLDTSAAPLSPSLKHPNSPTARTASPRSVSFRIDEPPLSQSRLDREYTVAEQDEEEHDVEPPTPVAPIATPSLADYVRSKASTSKPTTKLPSVADTIKKFSGAGMRAVNSSHASSSAQMPELQDLIRTHHREPPTEPTIPPLDKHSRLLKSRPRNANRRRPSQTPSAIQGDVPREQHSDGDSAVDADQFVPNQCARCTDAIADTWFRLSDGRQVHVECFTCQGCAQLIDDGVYVVESSIEYHPQCVPPAPPIVSVSPVSSRTSTPLKPRGPRDPRRDES
ncbi:hypothetical protein GGF43_004592, partial [Coemansia sp. RSA 2618]